MMRLLRIAIVLSALALCSSASYAVCCNSSGSFCADGTCATPCCGHGKCNIFCCNCDDGCRTGPCTGCNSADAMAGTADKFDSIDTNNDHAIDIKEFKNWAGGAGRYFATDADAKKAFGSADSNHNGKIEPKEFDSDLGKSYGKMKK